MCLKFQPLGCLGESNTDLEHYHFLDVLWPTPVLHLHSVQHQAPPLFQMQGSEIHKPLAEARWTAAQPQCKFQPWKHRSPLLWPGPCEVKGFLEEKQWWERKAVVAGVWNEDSGLPGGVRDSLPGIGHLRKTIWEVPNKKKLKEFIATKPVKVISLRSKMWIIKWQ